MTRPTFRAHLPHRMHIASWPVSICAAATTLALVACGGSEEPTEATTPPLEEVQPPASAEDGGGQERPAAEDGGATKPTTAAAEDDSPPPPPEPTVMDPPPPTEALTVHALAAYEIVTLYAKPDMSSTKLGYLRMGHRMMVTEKIDDQGEGCRKGWYQLESGSYACASKGLTVDASKAPYMHQPPPRPRIDDPMPYDYGVVARDGTAMWWRTADALERELATERFTIARDEAAAAAAIAEGKPPPPKTLPTPPKKADTPPTPPPATALPGVDDQAPPPPVELTPEQIAEQERKREEERVRAEEERKLRLEKMKTLPLHPETPFLEKGFIVTTALKIKDKGRSWWRTSRGGYLEKGKVYGKGTPKVLGLGNEIAETSGFPFGFVNDDKVPVFEKKEDGKLQRTGSLKYRDFVDGVERLELDGREYLRTEDERYLRVSDLRVAEPQTLPEGVEEGGRWIDVQLSEQLLVAYEGERPVFATLVSTGRKGTEEEPFDTPTGTFQIQTKHISSTMDGNTASDGAYSIQDVPWAMFFHGNYALHGAFWHSGFGGRRSHGCINLAPADARWLFWWVGPELPEGWHGAAAHEDAPGTTVVVR